MENNKYLDPSNWEDISNKLKIAPTLGDVKQLFESTFPNIIIAFLPKYSDDYPSLSHNWGTICTKSKTFPKQIMVLDDFILDENHKLVKQFCECFTLAGFNVRRKMEVIPCKYCSSAIPAELFYKILKDNGEDCPNSYSLFCSSCPSTSE